MKDSLEAQASSFAEDLTATVRALVPDVSPFRARVLESSTVTRFTVRQEPDTGIPLLVAGQPLLTLKVKYECALDGVDQYLAINESTFHVFPGDKAAGEPLLRYHYRRTGSRDVPSAHLHVHAHRDATTHVMDGAGAATRRGKQRAKSTDVPRMHELHFPLGGHRFRPCLEDLLEMLVTEFGVDSTPMAISSLRTGREVWRRKQLRTVVRDDPSEAASVLRSIGFQVLWPNEAPLPAQHPTRFTDF